MRSILEAALNRMPMGESSSGPSSPEPAAVPAPPVNRHTVRDARTGRFTTSRVIRVRNGKVVD